jgi:hypothetical protein
MGHLIRVSTCNLNQWALDWKGNRERIKASIREAKRQGVSSYIPYYCPSKQAVEALGENSFECLPYIKFYAMRCFEPPSKVYWIAVTLSLPWL